MSLKICGSYRTAVDDKKIPSDSPLLVVECEKEIKLA